MARKRNVKLLLMDNVENLGIVGDVVNVRPGYARNYLLPMGLADLPTDANMRAVEQRRAEVERQLREQRARQEKMIEQMDGYEITLQRAANEEGNLYGSVTQADIAAQLTEEGFELTERAVRIGDPIKHLDTYTIPIQLADDLKAEIKLWVVSDKPAEELLAQAEEATEQEEAAEDESEPAAAEEER